MLRFNLLFKIIQQVKKLLLNTFVSLFVSFCFLGINKNMFYQKTWGKGWIYMGEDDTLNERGNIILNSAHSWKLKVRKHISWISFNFLCLSFRNMASFLKMWRKNLQRGRQHSKKKGKILQILSSAGLVINFHISRILAEGNLQ